MTPQALQQAAELLRASRRSLIFTHLRPDGDALGSSFGLQETLRKMGLEAEVFLPGPLPNRHAKLFSGQLTKITPEELKEFDTFIALDCANPPRLGIPECLSIEELRGKRFINIDHHRANSLESGFFDLVSPESASCCEVLTRIFLECRAEITPRAATCFLAGMMTDTGCFRFANTGGGTLREAAELLDRGAELEKIVNALFFSKPLNQVRFENELMNSCLRLSAGGRIASAFIPRALLDKYDFDLREDEGLIDLLREIDGVVFAVLFHRGADGVKVSLRSKDRAFPVGPLARSFGGGGHDMAAGATLDLPDAEAEAVILERLTALLP